ncbi:unnamed protein product [Rhizophagus irregularis]|nr:unnamed protein product [Rhizophagus irregularis]
MSRQQRQPQNEMVSCFILVTVLGNTVIRPHYLVHIPQFTFYKLQIWRLYTSFFLYGLSLSGAFQLYFLYTYSRDVEIDKFLGRTADYVFPFVRGFNDTYSRMRSNSKFMFGIRFKGVYLPFVLLIFEMLQVGGIPWHH